MARLRRRTPASRSSLPGTGPFYEGPSPAWSPESEGISFEDVEQEARIELWRALQNEREISHPSSYIYKVAITCGSSRRFAGRRPGGKPLSRTKGSTTFRMPPGPPDPEGLARRQETLRKLDDALARLTERPEARRFPPSPWNDDDRDRRDPGLERGEIEKPRPPRAQGFETRARSQKGSTTAHDDGRAEADSGRSAPTRAPARARDASTKRASRRFSRETMSSKARAEAGSHIALCQDCADEFRALRSARGVFERKNAVNGRGVLPRASRSRRRSSSPRDVSIALFRYRGETERRSAELARQHREGQIAALVEAERSHEAEVADLRERLESAVSARLDVPILDLDPFHATRSVGERSGGSGRYRRGSGSRHSDPELSAETALGRFSNRGPRRSGSASVPGNGDLPGEKGRAST